MHLNYIYSEDQESEIIIWTEFHIMLLSPDRDICD